MEQRRLGRTEHRSSVAILGGAAYWGTDSPDEARPSFEAALAAGVNHLDIAPRYGAAERVVGPLLPAVRDQLFVAGKTARSNPDGAEAQFDDTRRLLGCEVLDLYQAHGVTSLEGSTSAGQRHRADPGPARTGCHPLRRGSPATTSPGPGHLQRGPPPLGPRHRDVPRLPRAVGRPPLPGRCRGAARHVRTHATSASWPSRRWLGGPGRTTAVAAPAGDALGDVVVRALRRGDAIASGHRLPLSTPGVAAFCTPATSGCCPGCWRRESHWPSRRATGRWPVEAMAPIQDRPDPAPISSG